MFRSLLHEWDRDTVEAIRVELTRGNEVPASQIESDLQSLKANGYVDEYEPGQWKVTAQGRAVEATLLGGSPSKRDWEELNNGISQVRIEHSDGTFVTDGSRAQLVSVAAQPRSPAETQLVIYDELRAERRRIPGDALLRIRRPKQADVVTVLVVDDSVPPDEGPTLRSRGSASPPNR